MAQDLFARMDEHCMLDKLGCSFADGPPRYDLGHLAQAMVVSDMPIVILSRSSSYEAYPLECS